MEDYGQNVEKTEGEVWQDLILTCDHLEMSQGPSQPLLFRSLQGLCSKQGNSVSHVAVQPREGLQEIEQDTFSQYQAAWWPLVGGQICTEEVSMLRPVLLPQPGPHRQRPAAALSLSGILCVCVCVFRKCHSWSAENPMASRDPGIHTVLSLCWKGVGFLRKKNQSMTWLTSQKSLSWKENMPDRT